MLIVALFALGYLAIVFEHPLKLNKSATALLTGVACWIVADGDVTHYVGELSQILFFLLGAMTIVEMIDAHDGFDLITSRIRSTSRRKLLVTLAVIGFFLSAVLDNLTTAIVMMSLARKLTSDDRDRMYFGAIVIIAANSGGAWSPIGDVTTTMLWIGGQITTTSVIQHLIIPSLVSVAVPVLWFVWRMKGDVTRPTAVDGAHASSTPFDRNVVLVIGVGVLLGVPVFKTLTHLPPFMGMLAGLGILWAATEILHKKRDGGTRGPLSAAAALQRVDTQSVLFFVGILLAITALQSKGLLADLARAMEDLIGNTNVITLGIGLASAVVDNVPLVAAAQGMYSTSVFPTDHTFWLFLTYCAGTGGSILIIGSAAGVAVMGIQQISFGWYVRRISLPALLGYAAGAGTYLLLRG